MGLDGQKEPEIYTEANTYVYQDDAEKPGITYLEVIQEDEILIRDRVDLNTLEIEQIISLYDLEIMKITGIKTCESKRISQKKDYRILI